MSTVTFSTVASQVNVPAFDSLRGMRESVGPVSDRMFLLFFHWYVMTLAACGTLHVRL